MTCMVQWALTAVTTWVCAGQYVFWHSSAHILGEAMECHYGGHLCYGPPVEGGFYYDMWTEEYVQFFSVSVLHHFSHA